KSGYHESRAVHRYVKGFADKWRAVEGLDEGGVLKSGVPILAISLRDKLSEDVKGKELEAEAAQLKAELASLLQALTPSRDETEERERIVGQAQVLIDAVQREMSRRCSGAPYGELMRALVVPKDDLEDEVRAALNLVAPMSIKVSDKVKKV